MKINNANEASQIVREFINQMGGSVIIKPRKAEKTNEIWVVEFMVGFDNMRFELNADTGELLRYETLK